MATTWASDLFCLPSGGSACSLEGLPTQKHYCLVRKLQTQKPDSGPSRPMILKKASSCDRMPLPVAASTVMAAKKPIMAALPLAISTSRAYLHQHNMQSKLTHTHTHTPQQTHMRLSPDSLPWSQLCSKFLPSRALALFALTTTLLEVWRVTLHTLRAHSWPMPCKNACN